jgi:cytochrome c oxidase assembly protein subunit 15
MNHYPLSRRLLHAFAFFAAAYTFLVLASGGLVTSHGVGMAVPDWPTTFGYNMFLFPISRWTGGIFYEHSHRLLATWIGIFSLVLAVWLWIVEPRKWVKILGAIAFAAVCVQGILGGLRVLKVNADFGIFHGLLAQSILVLLAVLAVVTSRPFVAGRWSPPSATGGLRWLALALFGFVFVQLAVAATMRHAHAGLSIPDFPAAYGRILPDTSPEALAAINAQRAAAVPAEPPTTAGLIWLQMTHRFIAAGILLLAVALAWRARHTDTSRMTLLLLAMIAVQITLGICTIWFDKPADIATSHMALGALTLVVSALLAFRFFAMQTGHRHELLEFSPTPANYSKSAA